VADAGTKQLEQLRQLCLEAEQLRDAALRLCADLGEQIARAPQPDVLVSDAERRRHDRRRRSGERRQMQERRRGARRVSAR